MTQMYEAMKKLAASNPDFAKTFEKAQEDRKERIAQEAEESRKRNAAAYHAKLKREQEEAERKEADRRTKELQVMATKLPFCYSYCHAGSYTMAYGIVFADSTDGAIKIMSDKITADFLDCGNKTINDLSTYDREYYEKALKTLRVHQADLSEGHYCCGTYME